MGPPDSLLWIKLPQQGPTLVLPFASPPPTFPLGVINPRVIFILAPLGQCLSKCWSKPSDVRCPLGNQGLCQPDVLLIRCALRTRYVQLLSGCRRIGWSCWSCFTIVKMSCNRDSETDRVFLGEGISFIDHESLSWAKLGYPCRV